MANTVTIETPTEGAVARYTLDGTDPTSSSSIYTAPLTVSPPLTIKVRAYKDDLLPSDIVSAYIDRDAMALGYSSLVIGYDGVALGYKEE